MSDIKLFLGKNGTTLKFIGGRLRYDHGLENAVLISNCRLFVAACIFDGIQLHTDKALLIEGDNIKQVGMQEELAAQCN